MRAYIIDADLPEELYVAIEPHIVGEVLFENYRCRWMQRGKVISDMRSYNAKLKELAKFLYGELVKDVVLVDVDGEESIAPWGEEYMEPIRERMVALGVQVDALGRDDE